MMPMGSIGENNPKNHTVHFVTFGLWKFTPDKNSYNANERGYDTDIFGFLLFLAKHMSVE